MSKTAVILAGGKGTRLRPYTISLPKPLVPVGDYPVLEIIVRKLVQEGFNHIILAVNHQADIIKAYFGNGSRWNARIEYSAETTPLSTMGPLTLIKDIPENFLVLNGDVLTDMSFSALYEAHEKNNHLLTISTAVRTQKLDYGVLETRDNIVWGFREKPTEAFEVSMGVYVLNRSVLTYIPYNTFFGFDHLVLKMLESNTEIHAAPYSGFWLDIGRPSDYEEAVRRYADGGIPV